MLAEQVESASFTATHRWKNVTVVMMVISYCPWLFFYYFQL